MKNRKIALAAATAAVAALTLAACGTPSENVTDDIKVEVSESAMGDNPGTWTPVTLTAANAGGFVNVFVGQSGVIPQDYVAEVFTSDPAVVTVSQPMSDGSVEFNAGFTAVAPGTAQVSAVDAAGKELGTWTVIVANAGQEPVAGVGVIE